MQTRDGGDEGFFEEAELAVPDHFDAGEDRGKQNRHADDAGGEELDVVAAAGFLVDGAKAVTEGDQEEQGLAEGADDAGLGAVVAFELAEPEDVYGSHLIS